MISLLFSFLLLLISLYLLSFPYQVLLQRYIDFDRLTSLITAIIVFISILTFFGSYIWQLNLTVIYFHFFLLLHVIFSASFVFVKFKVFLKSLDNIRMYIINHIILILGLCFVVILVSSPSFISLTNFSMPQRTGPDANGLLAVANYIGSGGTLENLKTYNFTNLGVQNLDEIFNLTKIYELDSTNKQIISEFALGSLRFTFPYLLVSLKSLLFWLSYFQIATIMATLSTFIICCASIAILKNRSRAIKLLGLLTSATSPIFLNLWYEGSYSQVFATTFLLSILLILQNLTLKNTKSIYLLATLFLFSAFLIYPDTIFILILVLFPCLIYFGFMKTKLLLRYGLILMITFFVLQLHFVIEFLDWISRRFNDASQGGWPQPFWPDLFSYVGLSNPFLNYTPYEQMQTNLRFMTSVITNIIMLVFLLFLIKLKSSKIFVLVGKSFLISTFTMLILFQIFSRLVLSNSNYQILKIAGTLSPLVIIIVIYILKYLDFNFKKLVSVFSITLILVSILARGTYLFDFVDSPHNVNARLNSTEYFAHQDLLSNSNIVTPINLGTGGLEFWNLSVYFDIRLVNRSASNNDRIFEDIFDIEKPFVILFDRNSCIDLNCSSFESYPEVKTIYGDLMVLPFAPNSKFLKGVKIGDLQELMFNPTKGLAYDEYS